MIKKLWTIVSDVAGYPLIVVGKDEMEAARNYKAHIAEAYSDGEIILRPRDIMINTIIRGKAVLV